MGLFGVSVSGVLSSESLLFFSMFPSPWLATPLFNGIKDMTDMTGKELYPLFYLHQKSELVEKQ